METIIYWVRSIAVGGVKDRVPVYLLGRHERHCQEGWAGDCKVRPVSLGPGEYTMTVSAMDCEWEDGRKLA
jgi:hypothetical protein